MANVISSAASVRLDNEGGTITLLAGGTATIVSVGVSGGMNLLDDTGLGDTREQVLAGLAVATEVSINGLVNSTTEAIMTPLLDQTSITKTVGVGLVSGQYLNGEAWPRDVSVDSSQGAISTFALTLQAQDGLTRTSVVAT